MSTTDPRVARTERARLDEGSPTQMFLATVYGLASVVAGASAAYGFVCVMDQFRLMVINGIFDNWDSPLLDRWPTFLFPGVIGVIVFGSLAKRAGRRFGGGYGRLMSALACWPFGALAVAVAAPSLMTRPTTVGVNEDPSFHEPQRWGAEAWIMYRLPDALPVIGFLLVVVSIVLAVRRIRRVDRLTGMVQHGARTTGRVIEVSGGNVRINNMPVVTLSVQFTDATGTVRYVTKKKPIPELQVPVPDQQVLVIYDPANPADEKGIALGLGASDAIGDALR